MKNEFAIGVDIGGTHITCAAVNLAEGRLLPGTLYREAYHHEAAADLVLRAWATALNRSLLHCDETNLAGIGFAIPGPFDYRNGISHMEHKFRHLNGLHIPTALNPMLMTEKDQEMRFLNDATAFGAGEAWQGQGRGFEGVVIVTLGTGFGSAFLRQGIPVVSGNSVPKAGCLWHLPFQDGIADDYFSTRWFLQEYEKQSGLKFDGGVMELVEKNAADPLIPALFTRFGRNLGECLAPWLTKFRAEILIIGGNISHALPLFERSMQEVFQAAGLRIPAVPSELMETAALLGSARLMDDDFWAKASAEFPEL